MKHALGYMWSTRFTPTKIAIDEEGNDMMHVDGSHATHSDGKGYSFLVITMGKGAMINVSKKLGLVTMNSTETEVVSTGKWFPKCTWFRYFSITHGDEVKEDVLFQDNKSHVLSRNNYHFSTGKGTKYINVRYFFVVDKIEKKELKVLHCPTEHMIADYKNKQTQGRLFVRPRNIIQGVSPQDIKMHKE